VRFDFGSTRVVIPTDVAATLVAEIFVPDSDAVGHKFFPGTNTGTETQPGYVRGPTCNIPEPATYNSLNFPLVKLVLTVTDTY
jgi:hypothetical protein